MATNTAQMNDLMLPGLSCHGHQYMYGLYQVLQLSNNNV